MNNYLKLFHEQLKDYQAKCGTEEPVPILEVLWQCYYQSNPTDDGCMRLVWESLHPAFDNLSFDASNLLFDNLNELITAHQRAAFLEGIQIGVQLTKELQKKCTP